MPLDYHRLDPSTKKYRSDKADLPNPLSLELNDKCALYKIGVFLGHFIPHESSKIIELLNIVNYLLQPQ